MWTIQIHLDKSSAVEEMGDRLATIDMGRKLGQALPPFWGGGAGSPSNTMSLGPRPTSLPSGILIHPAIWQQQTWAENWGSGCAPLGEGELGRHLTQYGQGRAYLHAKFHLDPSNCLATIHQCHRQDRQWLYSTGRTVVQTVAQKLEATDVSPNINRMQAAIRAEKCCFWPWWPWPLTLTFKLIHARDQTRLPCEFGANPFSSSPRYFIHKQRLHRLTAPKTEPSVVQSLDKPFTARGKDKHILKMHPIILRQNGYSFRDKSARFVRTESKIDKMMWTWHDVITWFQGYNLVPLSCSCSQADVIA